MALRAAYVDPSHPGGAHSLPLDINDVNIIIRHPGYDDHCNILMFLPGLDHPDGAIDYDTALAACGIVAGNESGGFFAVDRPGDRRIARPEDGLLRTRDCYFHISGASGITAPYGSLTRWLTPADKYPVVPSFRDWQFPRSLPSPWNSCPVSPRPIHTMPREATLTEAVLARDISCRLTRHIEGTEHAHLIPRAEKDWFDRNTMARFAQVSRAGIDAINVPRNAVALRSDIHTLFDSKRFVIVPKRSRSPLAWFAHVVIPGQHPQMTHLYHNVAMQSLTGIAVEYLFARFAWAIFDSVQTFVSQGSARLLSVYDDFRSITVELTGEQLRAHLAGQYPKSRSESPRKKSSSPSKRPRAEDVEDEEEPRGRRRSFTSAASREHTPWLSDEETRGRRKRRFHSPSKSREHTPWLTNDDSPSPEESQCTDAARDTPQSFNTSDTMRASKRRRKSRCV